MSADRRRAAHLVPLAAVQAVGLACGLVGVRWTSAVVPPEVMGFYGLLVATHLTATSVTHQGLIRHVQRHWTTRAPAAAYARQLAAALPRSVAGLGLLLAGALVVINLSIDGHLSPAWWAWMLAVNLLVLGATAAQSALQAEERYWAHFTVSAVCSATRSFLPPLLVMAGGSALVMLGGGFLLHALLWALAATWFLRPAWSRPAEEGALAHGGPGPMIGAFFQVGLYGWVAGMAPRWFAALVLPPEATGHFMLAGNLSAIVPAAVSLIGIGYSFPPLYAAARAGAGVEELRRMCHRTVAVVLLAGQAGLLLLAWCGPWLVGPVVDARYAPSMDWLLATGGAALAGVSGVFFTNLLVARDRERDCIPLVAVSAGLRVAAMAGLTLLGDEPAFRLGLAILPWPTLLLELWLTGRLLNAPGRPPAAGGPAAESAAGVA